MGEKTVNQASAPVPEDKIDASLANFARKQFFTAAVNMGWQLALTILVPVFIGVKLDSHFHESPSYTLAALVLSIGGAVFVVRNTLKQVARDQAKQRGSA